MSNTDSALPIEQRSTPQLVEDLCLELRHVGVGDYDLPDDPRAVSHIQQVQGIHVELEKRQVDVVERIEQLSTETNWQMHELLRDCLAFPQVIPYVRENDGIRRTLRCYRCQQREAPDLQGIRLCDVCLASALYSVESRIPDDGFVLFRIYNPSKWCEHADADTVLIALDRDVWIDDGYCRICLTEEQLRRTRVDRVVMHPFGEGEASEGAWNLLSDAERDTVWERFYAEFSFRPSVYPQDWPGILEPTPSLTYSISAVYAAMSNPRVLENDLNVKILGAFQRCVEQGDRLYVLDWQHDCYWFYPHRLFDARDSRAWKVPVLPNGDYYIFLAEDLSFGLFGHPWEQTICVFGQVLLDALAHDMPLLFAKPVRRDGKEINVYS